MFKRIRDFVYDINDIFIALILVLAAVGVIVWRSVDIMNYPKYLANKPASTVVENIDIPDDPADPVDPNSSADPGNNEDPNGSGQQGAAADPKQGTEQNQNTASNQNAAQNQNTTENTDKTENKDNTEKTENKTNTAKPVTATINIESGFKGGWNTVVNRLVSAGLIKSSDKTAFINKVIKLKLDRSLRVGTYKLSSDMSHEEMIKILCKVK